MLFKCRLKLILWEKEMKQGDFAKQVGLSSSALSSLVNNKTLPSFETTYKISKELNLAIHEIWEEVKDT